MGHISTEAFRRLFLFGLIAQFRRGCDTKKRLQKVSYFATSECQIHPYTYKHWHFGQYSDQVEDTRRELEALGYIQTVPLGDSEAVNYRVYPSRAATFLRHAVNAMGPSCLRLMADAVKEYGYLPEDELVSKAYEDELLRNSQMGEVLLSSNIEQGHMTIALPEEECWELELALSPKVVNSLKALSDGLEICPLK